jgi:Zn finger protein HypA/HybF involved in hydrogenase expression
MFTKQQLEPIVASSKSIVEVKRKLNTKCHCRIIKKDILQFNLSTKHFLGQASTRGKIFKKDDVKLLDKILIENSTYTNLGKLKIKLIRVGIFSEKCNCCNNVTWLHRKIPLELNHKNGHNRDHRKENLELLCPNCHALTNFYCGSNMKISRRFKAIEDELLTIFGDNYLKKDLKHYCFEHNISYARAKSCLKDNNKYCWHH